jgi:thiol:disulfide interchange protein
MIRALLLCLALGAPVAQAASPQDLLEPEQAFRFSARALAADAIEVRFEIAEGYYLYRERFKFTAHNARLGAPQLPAGERKKDEFFGDTEVYRKEVRIRVPVAPGAADPLKLAVTSQGCADLGVCYVPMESQATLSLAAFGGDSVPGARRAAGGRPAFADGLAASDLEVAAMFAGNAWLVLASFLGFGLLLAFTPCVLPMIPINLAIIGAGTQAGIGDGFPSRARGFMLGAAYGGAMAVVYGVLGLVVILTAGTFGTINSSPWFNLAIAAIFVVLGLAMFDVIMIDFSSWSTRFTPGAHTGTFVMAFAMGAVAALLAGACVAPVVIQVVLFSSNLYATGTKLALALPFFLGLGMAIPWPIAGAGIAALPKPGMWMVRVKQAFGVFILATALYYGYESYSLFANRWVDPALVASSVEEQLKSGWHASLAEGLAAAKRENKPVLIDMWATWCKNCLTMDKTTLASDEVKSALSNYVKIKYQAEDPDAQPAKGIMQKFSAPGLPAYAILKPKT